VEKVDKSVNNQIALVTGASSGIGLSIVDMLLEKGYIVYGIGRNFDQSVALVNKILTKESFHPLQLDVENTPLLLKTINDLKKSVDINVLVNNAGVGYFGPHEELNAKKIKEMTNINLTVPMLLTQLLLRDIKKKKGYVFFISSVTAQKSNTHGCAYGATKAGLTSFAKSLFDEVRKYGVKITVIHPDMTKSNFYRNADFMEGEQKDTYVESHEIAETMFFLLDQREGLVITELTIKPQKHQIKRK